jgi:hypothetical protein
MPSAGRGMTRMRIYSVGITLAALTTIIGFFLPWFTFTPTLPLDLEPGAVEAFHRAYPSIGPLDAFTHAPFDGIGIALRLMAAVVLLAEMALLVAALVLLWRRRPWRVGLPILLSPGLIAILFISYFSYFFTAWGVVYGMGAPQVIPAPGWWMSLVGSTVILICGIGARLDLPPTYEQA